MGCWNKVTLRSGVCWAIHGDPEIRITGAAEQLEVVLMASEAIRCPVDDRMAMDGLRGPKKHGATLVTTKRSSC